MELYFAGAERAANRVTLARAGVQRVAVNVTHFRRPKKAISLKELCDGAEIMAYMSENDTDIDRFAAFVNEYHAELSVVVGCNGYVPQALDPWKFWPLWETNDVADLRALLEGWGQVTVSDKALADAGRLRAAQGVLGEYGGRALLLSSKTSLIARVPTQAVMVQSWQSAARYGELQVWDGRTLHRYATQQKELARRRHRGDIAKLGVDFEAIMEDDVAAATTLALRSWSAWEVAQNGQVATNEPEEALVPYTDPPGIGLATTTVEDRHEDDVLLLPTISLSTTIARLFDEGGDEEVQTEEYSVVESSQKVLRACDTCYLASKCPAFKPGSRCAYRIPVQIRTKDQLSSFLTAIIELQGDRVLFAQFGELLEGQGIDGTVSNEMDRLFKLASILKDISDGRDTFKLSLEAKSKSMAGAGVLSRLFGAKVGEQARTLPGGGYPEEETNALMQQMLS